MGEVSKGGWVELGGERYALIPYGSETIDGADPYSLSCHVCGAHPGTKHRRSCTLGSGALHERPADCRDCGVAIGAVHVIGCCIELCPCCLDQYMSCDCDGSEDPDTGDDS